MFYHLFDYLEQFDFPGAGMFQYITFRSACAVILSLLIATVVGKRIIRFLQRQQVGEEIRNLGLEGQMQKRGTPTMGGIIILLAILVPVLLFARLDNVYIILMVVATVWLGLIGFLDDYIKVVKKRNLGLRAWQKLILQFLVAGAYLVSVFLSGGTSQTMIPFAGMVDLGITYWILSLFIIVGMVNAVNFTDGIDGLNGSVTFFYCIFFMLISSFLNMGGMSILAVASAGGCMGFLLWNFNPAKVFMGDTGSLFLGGMVCALAFGTDLPVLLFPLGSVYILEILSVVLQVSYFKLTHGKRLFKMSPIHHHFEMCGWGEMKICIVASAVTILMGIGCVFLVLLGCL